MGLYLFFKISVSVILAIILYVDRGKLSWPEALFVYCMGAGVLFLQSNILELNRELVATSKRSLEFWTGEMNRLLVIPLFTVWWASQMFWRSWKISEKTLFATWALLFYIAWPHMDYAMRVTEWKGWNDSFGLLAAVAYYGIVLASTAWLRRSIGSEELSA